MSSRPLEATAVHTVTLVATSPAEARTVSCDIRDVFSAPTRVVAVARLNRPEPELAETSTTLTGERTMTWTRPQPNNASTAAFAQTEALAAMPARSRLHAGGRTAVPIAGVVRVALVALVVLAMVLAAALATGGTGRLFHQSGTVIGSASSAVHGPIVVEVPARATPVTSSARSPARRPRSSEELASLEAAAADALLAGKPQAALARYRELAAVDGSTFARVVKILERAP